MKQIFKIILAVLTPVVLFIGCKSQSDDLAGKVNPFIGTDYTGNTYPGASSPFGMVQLSPDNGRSGWDYIAGYFYPDSILSGFSHTHLSGTGAGDLYDISFFPVTLPYLKSTRETGVYSSFNHQSEEAYAGYYRVKLEDYNIDVELTTTPRCGIQQYTFPKGKSAVLLNLDKAMNWDFTQDSYIEIIDSCTIRGYRFSKGWAPDQRIWFVSRFSKPFEGYELSKSAVAPNHGFTSKGPGYQATFHYTTAKNEKLVICTGISAVSYEGAFLNLQHEAPHNDFAEYRDNNRAVWNKELSRVKVKMLNHDEEVSFYTALYHTMLAPTLYSDVDGKYRGPDGEIHQANGWDNYSTFSLWDTYRAAHPLYIMLQPERTRDMMLSLLAFGREHGRLPVWNFAGCETDMMIGYHAAVVLAEACLKGIPIDGKEALGLALATANTDSYRGIGIYKNYGYIPFDKQEESVSKTLEYAYDDYAIGLLAQKLGHNEIAGQMLNRSRSYRNLWDSETGFFRPRNSKGKWLSPFNPMEYSAHYTESNAWQYLWSVPQDIHGLIELMGGAKALENKLDEMFMLKTFEVELPVFSTGMIGQYAHGNEPGHHVAYLYNYTEHPEKGEKILRQIMNELYLNAPGGLCGNEDCGQMSAWYVFSALGFYPVDPVSGFYEVGTPLVEWAEIALPGNKTLEIQVERTTPRAYHVGELTLNGKKIHNRRLSHADLMQGGTLVFRVQ